MRAMRTSGIRLMGNARQLTLPALAIAAAVSIVLAFSLSGCVNVAGYTQPTLVRVIDASYVAPAINVLVEGTIVAGNIGQGTISPYATLTATTSAPVKIADAATGGSLTTTSNPFLAGHQYSVYLTDLGNPPTTYTVSVLTDQQTAAAAGHFLNQAIKTGAVDVYMVPYGSTLAQSIPLVSNLAVGASFNYVDFASQTVTMVVTPTGKTTPKYTSTTLYLGGGEVRTVLLVDAQLTSDPPILAYMASDVN
jgi:hypothetical protein